MKTAYIQKGQAFYSSEQLLGHFNLNKWLYKILNYLHIPYDNSCCDELADSAPVRFSTGLQYFNGTDWVSASTAGSQVSSFYPTGTAQALSGAGAINVTSYYTAWTTTAANAGTLANGTAAGQLKKIRLVSDGGDGTLTPTSLTGGTTITFNDANDFVELLWTGTSWIVLENSGAVVA